VANQGKVEFNYQRAVLFEITDTIALSVSQVFEADIKPMAQELSPVDRGTNRRSITTETQRTPDGSVMAEIFTQSGYGGYLELGHRVHIGKRGSSEFSDTPVQGKPYIYPAFMANQDKILEACKTNLTGLGTGSTATRIL
jgi:hypothetical protein